MGIIITGASGFVGSNLKFYLSKYYFVKELSARYKKNQKFFFEQDTIIHLAGKAHDLKKKADSNVYNEANFKLTKQLFDSFLLSKKTKTFIYVSSVKAVAYSLETILTEKTIPSSQTDYRISKHKAELYILNKEVPKNKRYFILRPCMIHGPNNKGNLNLLYNLVKKRKPWPLGKFENKPSFFKC
jgi:nucleoside-diphosphate-sugar epimerase